MPLARLRMDLDFLPSPSEERPGIVIRDPYGYSDAQLLIPQGAVGMLRLFDGETSELDARHLLVQATKDVTAGDFLDQLHAALDQAGFLENETHARMKEVKHESFRQAHYRLASHAGPGGYPPDSGQLRETFDGYFRGAQSWASDNTRGIAAPHVSPFGGWECYAEAYQAIPRSAADKTFVVLGTSHYGAPNQFGLTRKPFLTPYGETTPAGGLIDELERRGGPGVVMEDYCHAAEHSIEFQVVFLQHLFGPHVKVLPILCGPFLEGVLEGKAPEENEHVRRFFDALGEIEAREASQLFWVLGIDMAHMGRRYGDDLSAQAHLGDMMAIGGEDQSRIMSLKNGNAAEFWAKVSLNQDPLKWCGSSPAYTFLKAAPNLVGNLMRYDQWNIDEESVVSFAAMRFEEAR